MRLSFEIPPFRMSGCKRGTLGHEGAPHRRWPGGTAAQVRSNPPALTLAVKSCQSSRVNVSAGPFGSFESRTSTFSTARTSTQFPPLLPLARLLRHSHSALVSSILLSYFHDQVLRRPPR